MTTVSKKERQKILNEELKKRGASGGKQTLKRHGTGFYSKIGKKGVKARLSTRPSLAKQAA